MIYLSIGLAGAIVIFAIVFYTAKRGLEWEEEHQYSTFRDPDHWYALFYINPKDKRIFVQKKRAGGYTINLGNPIGIFITLVFVVRITWVIYIGH